MTTSVDRGHQLASWNDLINEAMPALESGSGTKADFSRESVGAFWHWLKPQLSYGPYFHSSDDPLDTVPETLPEWAKIRGLWVVRKMVTPENLKLIGYLARYYGECLKRQVPEAEWLSWTWHDPDHAALNEGEIALSVPLPPHLRRDFDYASPVFPISDVGVMVSRSLGDSPESTELTGSYDIRLADLQGSLAYIRKNNSAQ
ncbi:MAG TPA: hypothetical protein VLF62_06140 [Candidatus Saccharimonadales bacterium]|nr:hypothetical protein [Candidatus Saccharimonadales bacterium]